MTANVEERLKAIEKRLDWLEGRDVMVMRQSESAGAIVATLITDMRWLILEIRRKAVNK